MQAIGVPPGVRNRRSWSLLVTLGVAAVLAACSGGGGSRPTPVIPESSTPPKTGSGTFELHIPKSTAQSHRLKPAYISPATNSVSFQISPNPPQVVALDPGSAACPLSGGTYTCTATFQAPIGASTMVVETFASTDGSGTPLSMNSIAISIVAGQNNVVNAVLNGVVATLTLSLNPSSVVSGTASTVQATWGGLDSSDYVIIGPGSLVGSGGNAITPSLTSSSSNFVVTPIASASPIAWTIAYNGTATTSSPTITLSASGYSSVADPLTVNPAPTPTPSSTTDWDSFGYDLERSGYYPNESSIGTSNVSTLQKVWSFNVGDGDMRQAVLANGVSIAGQSTNVLYAGSNWGSTMYALNADTGTVIWKLAVPSAPYSCSGSNSQFSIAGTPAIDRGKNRIYFADGHNQLHALDLSTGVEASGWPIIIADYTPDHNFMHGGLAYNPVSGILYAVTGSTCDISPWYGRIVAINTSSATVVGTFYPNQGNSGGGIWGPGGPAIDPSTNDVFIATGNADTTTGQAQSAGYSEQVVELSPNLGTVLANNYPPNIPSVTGDDDFDFGATPLLFQPPGCPPLLAAVNKSGMFELYDRSSIDQGPVQFIAMSMPTDRGSFVGTPTYDPVTNYVYVGLPSSYGIYQAGVGAFSVQSSCTLNATPVWSAQFGPDGSTTSGQTPRSPITIANGVLYVSNYSGETEYAFNAATGAALWSTALTGYGLSGTIVANGKAYVEDSSGEITAWALP
jgi:outer membrane protein assembly factor BamB